MNLSSIKLTPFYSYWKDADGVKYKLPSDSSVEGGVKITKEEFENVDSLTAGNDTDSSNTVGRADIPESPTHETPVGSGSLVPIDAVAGVTDTFGPADFQVILHNLDELVGEQTGISQLQLDMARKYVSEIMTTLKEYPEFEPILVDRDVHNVMVFVQSSMNLATADFIVKKQKKETAATRKSARESKAGSMTFNMIAFESEEVKGGMDFGAAFAGSATDLSTLNLDDVKPKSRGEK